MNTLRTTTTLTGSNKSNLFFEAPLPNEKFKVFQRNTPVTLYTATEPLVETEELDIYRFVDTTRVPESPKRKAVDLKKIHVASGLTWNQLANLFNVSVRSIHLWSNEVRQPTDEHCEMMSQLQAFLKKHESKPPFQIRQLLEKSLLTNFEKLNEFHSGNFQLLLDLDLPVVSNRKRLPIAPEFFASRLPTDPVVLMSAESVTAPTVKSKKAVKKKVKGYKKK